ncbi:hypothetical protein PJ311_14105 [Bacillus sp. CLL-7-23]|uniref:Uncharacterized protein n=1 Tax=Bacillus changyiensis TaxID=3004103 RepID=A0ABT4X5Z7_9BACI|nr:hypothetical protein [Bacillus changyiensis]MDA7027716.1 hypothetical protein [Bacillus changyiensis]
MNYYYPSYYFPYHNRDIIYKEMETEKLDKVIKMLEDLNKKVDSIEKKVKKLERLLINEY